MMGIYPDCPGEPFYTITSPVFEKVTVTTPRGNFEIKSLHSAPDSHYIEEIRLNGKRHGYRVKHSDLIDNGTLEIKLKKTK